MKSSLRRQKKVTTEWDSKSEEHSSEREDDNEFKLSVAQSDQYSENDIKKQIYFQKKYFKSKIVK